MVQAVTLNQAGVWVRTALAQSVRVQYTGPDGNAVYTDPVVTDPSSDDTARFMLRGLKPGASYGYRIGTTDPDSGVETWTGQFTFTTVRGTVESMNIAVLSDFADLLVASPALERALFARPDLLAIIGDLDHRSPAADPNHVIYPPEDAPQVLSGMRKMHRDTRDPSTPIGHDFWSGLIGDPDTGVPQIPMVYAWDDHDFCSNNSNKNCRFSAQAFQAFNEYYILASDNAYNAGCNSPTDFESLSYGNLVQLFFLDARSGRNDAKPDGKTAMLGTCQHNWLVNKLKKSKATWKIVLTPVPINATVKTWDSWSLFPTERSGLLDDIADVPNVVFISGDIHTGGAIDDGSHSGRPEVATPHANMPTGAVNTYCLLQAGVLESRPGSWTIGGLVDPTIGVSPMSCLERTYKAGFPVNGMSAPVYPLDGKNNPGYTWISASTTALTITVRNVDGDVKQGYTASGDTLPLQLSFSIMK
jgi:alkaline phosphatase D